MPSQPFSPLDFGLGPAGCTIFAVSGTISETNILEHPLAQLADVNYVVVHDDGIGADYVNRTNANLNATSPNWIQYLQGNPAGDFISTNTGGPVVPVFSAPSSDISIVMLSGTYNMGGYGDQVIWTWCYVFDEVTPPPPPPPSQPFIPCSNYATNDDCLGYDPINHVVGLTQGQISPGRIPTTCRPTICLNGAILLTSQGYPNTPLFVRNDEAQISALDILSDNIPVQCFRYRTAPVRLSDDERGHPLRAKRVRIFGSGIVTDGVIKVNCDSLGSLAGPGLTMKALDCLYVQNEPGVLFRIDIPSACVGRVIDVDLCINGIGIVIRDILIEVSAL
jgi:hypothetical protein